MLNANSLTTVSRLADFMGIDTPASGSAAERRLEMRINAVSSFIQRYTGIAFKKTAYVQEEYITEKGQTLNLKHYPVLNTEPFILERRNASLNEGDWEEVDGSNYSVDWESGIISGMSSLSFLRGRAIYRVSYSAGYDFDNTNSFLGDTEAGDIEMAIWLIAQDLENTSGSGSNVKSEKIGDYSITYNSVQIQGAAFRNSDALATLDTWKDIQTSGVLTPLQGV